jgi:hypothetical protein
MTKDEFKALAATWPDADCWDCDQDAERLTHTEAIEALEELIDRNYEKGVSCEDQIRAMGDVTLYGWTRKTPSDDDIRRLVRSAVDATLECMGEELEWSNPEEDEPPRDLPALFEAAIRKDLETRHILGCDQTHEIELTMEQTLDIARLEWPHWFE